MYAAAGLAALQLAGGYFASQNIKESARLNQDIANMNAEFAELDAYDAITEGYTQQARYQTVIDQTLSEQNLALAAADVDINYGTAATMVDETKFTGQMNLMEIQKQAEEKALGYKAQARSFLSAGAMNRADAEAKAAGVMFNSVVGAAQSGLSGYKDYVKSGASAPVDTGSGNRNPFR